MPFGFSVTVMTNDRSSSCLERGFLRCIAKQDVAPFQTRRFGTVFIVLSCDRIRGSITTKRGGIWHLRSVHCKTSSPVGTICPRYYHGNGIVERFRETVREMSCRGRGEWNGDRFCRVFTSPSFLSFRIDGQRERIGLWRWWWSGWKWQWRGNSPFQKARWMSHWLFWQVLFYAWDIRLIGLHLSLANAFQWKLSWQRLSRQGQIQIVERSDHLVHNVENLRDAHFDEKANGHFERICQDNSHVCFRRECKTVQTYSFWLHVMCTRV